MYYEFMKVQEENSHLLQEERELKSLSQNMERIQRDKNRLREYLDTDETEKKSGVLGPQEGGSATAKALTVR